MFKFNFVNPTIGASKEIEEISSYKTNSSFPLKRPGKLILNPSSSIVIDGGNNLFPFDTREAVIFYPF